MALKRKINKATFDKLSEEIKKEYKAGSSDDEFVLDTEGDEDTGALKRAKDREKQRADELAEKLAEATEQLAEVTNGDARKKGDIATLEKSWQKKLDDQKTASDAQVNKLTSHIKTQLIDNVASSLAAKISTSPALLLPHIRARLAADFEGDSPVTRVLDASGKPSASTLEDLQKEFATNKDFAAIIVASKASGGARPASQGNGGGAPNNQNQPPADLSKMNPKQLSEHIAAAKQAKQE